MKVKRVSWLRMIGVAVFVHAGGGLSLPHARAQTGACCLGSSCIETTEEDCAGAIPPGFYEGDGTSCPGNCADQGACCYSDGSCTEGYYGPCQAGGGVFQGDASLCTPNPCPQPSGACCDSGGSCSELTRADCVSGEDSYLGDFTDCDPNPCPDRPLGTAFIYQGQLNKFDQPVDGECYFRFTLWDAEAGGTSFGPEYTSLPVRVDEGTFVTDVDFGADVLKGQARWLELSVKCGPDLDFTPVTPRQKLTPVPYALRASKGVGGADALHVDPDDNIGIGTDSPSEKLEVVGNVEATGNIRADRRITSGNSITIDGATKRVISNGDLKLLAGDGHGLRIIIPVNPYEVNIVGGSMYNWVAADVEAATISGGGAWIFGENSVADDWGTVGGGVGNVAGYDDGSSGAQSAATVGGGYGNTASGAGGTVSGGVGNTAGGRLSTVPGGSFNTADGDHSFAAGYYATVRDAVAAGEDPETCSNDCGDEGTFVWSDMTTGSPGFTSTGPNQFLINATGGVGIGTNSPSEQLDVDGNIRASGTITSGGSITIDGVNDKIECPSTMDIFVGGERVFRLEPAVFSPNMIGGYSGNTVSGDVSGATIGGGGRPGPSSYSNRVYDHYGTISGGRQNMAGSDDGDPSSNSAATVGGGTNNRATGSECTVAGGWNNLAGWEYSAVGGGAHNEASGYVSTIPGGFKNIAAASFTLAAGHRAKAQHYGTFVWSDPTTGSPEYFTSTGAYQFLINATGGVGIGTNEPLAQLHVEANDISLSLDALDEEKFVVEATDAQLGLYSTSDGDYGSGIALGEIDGSGNLTDKWGIVRGTSGAPQLRLTYGLNPNISDNTNVMTIFTNGNVGIGTPEPYNELSVRGDANFTGSVGIGAALPSTALQVKGPESQVYQLYLQSDATSGAAGTGSGLGFLGYTGTEERIYAAVRGEKENGTFGNYAGALLLETHADGGSLSERMRITSEGYVGIGTDDPIAPLDVRHTNAGIPSIVTGGSADYATVSYQNMTFGHWDGATYEARIQITPTGNVGIGRFAAGNKLEVEGTASKTTAGDWAANSDKRIKTQITRVANALDTIDRLRPVQFKYTDDYRSKHPSIEDKHYLNYVAQEYQEVFPDFVKDSGDDGLLQIDTHPASIYAVAAVQELHKIVREKDAEIATQQRQIAELAARLAALEQLVNHADAGQRGGGR